MIDIVASETEKKKYFIQWYSVIISTGGNSVKGAGVGNR